MALKIASDASLFISGSFLLRVIVSSAVVALALISLLHLTPSPPPPDVLLSCI
jgi:hypothetical protein